jgi:hypothetical protein
MTSEKLDIEEIILKIKNTVFRSDGDVKVDFQAKPMKLTFTIQMSSFSKKEIESLLVICEQHTFDLRIEHGPGLNLSAMLEARNIEIVIPEVMF